MNSVSAPSRCTLLTGLRFTEIELVGADDTVTLESAVLVLQLDPGAEIDLIGISRNAVDDDHIIESFSKKTDAGIDFAQLLLAIDIFSILRTVTFGRRCSKDAGDFRPFDLPQVIMLFAQALMPLGCDIF